MGLFDHPPIPREALFNVCKIDLVSGAPLNGKKNVLWGNLVESDPKHVYFDIPTIL